MHARLFIALLVTALMAVGCSGGSKAEMEDEKAAEAKQPVEQAEKTEETKQAESAAMKGETELAACTGGNVPMGATNCLLDLGTGTSSYWTDTDGVAPGVAGCHYEFSDASCSNHKEGRTFGEFCLDDDRLVESNPGKDECHEHGADKGKPFVMSCSEWCQEESGSTGSCEGGIAVDGAHGSCEAARCVCDTTG